MEKFRSLKYLKDSYAFYYYFSFFGLDDDAFETKSMYILCIHCLALCCSYQYFVISFCFYKFLFFIFVFVLTKSVFTLSVIQDDYTYRICHRMLKMENLKYQNVSTSSSTPGN